MVEAMLFAAASPLRLPDLATRMPAGCDPAEAVARLRRRYELTRAGRPAGLLRGRLVQARWTYTLDLREELDVVPLLCMVGLIHQERPSYSEGFSAGIA